MKKLLFCLIILTFSGSSFSVFRLGSVSINLFRIAFGLFCLAALLYARPKNLNFPGKGFYKLLLFAIGAVLMLTFMFVYSIPEWIEGTLFMVINLLLILFIVMFTDDINDVNNYMKAYAIGVLINMIISVYEYSTRTHVISSNYLAAYEMGTWQYSTLSKAPTALLYNPNNVGVAVLLGLPYIGAFADKKTESVSLVKKSVWFLLCAYVAFATGSRGSILLIFVVIFAYILLERIRTSKKLFGIIAIVFVVCVVAYANSEFILKQLGYSGLAGQDTIIDATTDKSRIDNIVGGFEAVKNNWFFGSGPMSAERALYKTIGKNFSIHNFWVEWLITMGLPGMICFLMMYIRAIKSMFRSKTYQSKVVLVSLLTFMAASMIPPTIITLNFVWIIFGFSIAIEKLDLLESEKANVNTNVSV